MTDKEMFNTSWKFFREIMCSNKYTIAEKDTAYENLAQDYLRLDIKETEETFFWSITKEWGMRKAYELTHGIMDENNKLIKIDAITKAGR